MARTKTAEAGIRAFALDPLCNFKHQETQVPEWGGATIIIRALSAGDWVEYRRRAIDLVAAARVAAGLKAQPAPVAEGEEVVLEPDVEVPSSVLYAFVLARTLFDESKVRVFADEDVNEVAEAFSPVHDRLVGKAFELSGVEVGAASQDPVDAAGND